MSQTDEFFSDLKEWSARKLSIIRNYVDVFSKILGSKYKEIFYVDGFAGRGIYDNGEKGSPVLAAEASLAFQQGNKPFTLKCINIERDHDNFTNLLTETQRFGNLVKNIEGAFEDNIDTILTQTSGYPAVFFIDDFGIKGTGWNAVEKIASRKDSTDIWIRFDYRTALRLFGFYDSAAKEAQGKISTLQNLFGITDKKYLQSRLDGTSANQRVNNAINLYIEQLEQTFKTFGKNGFAASYPIISIDDERKYHLIFACTHRTAATLASNIVNGVEETYQREKLEYKTRQTEQMIMSGFGPALTENQIFEDKVKDLKTSILLLPKNKKMDRIELHYEILSREKFWFGKVGRKHLTRALKELLESKEPKIKSEGAPGNDKSVFTILE